jgi:F1F0 ATPase subunit 2
MNEALHISFSLLIGLVIGTLFFGGLWFTIKNAVTAKTPAIWFALSFSFRVAITLIGFYYTSLGNWQRLIACLIGFMIARFIITRYTKPKEAQQMELKKEVSHEA